MRALTLFTLFTLILLVLTSLSLIADEIEPVLVEDTNGDWSAEWPAEPDWTYFVQVSYDLFEWEYLAIIERTTASGQILGSGLTLNPFANGNTRAFIRVIGEDFPLDPGKTELTSDFDQDGRSNWTELDPPSGEETSDPLSFDTDGDGLDDLWEVIHGLDPNDQRRG